MTGAIVMLLMLVLGAAGMVFWNKKRLKGKMVCFFLQGDIYVKTALCEYQDDFVFYNEKAYDIYPDRVRLIRFPTGMPDMFRETVPAALYDVTNGIPLDWKNPPVQSDARLRSMNIKSALMENMLRKMVEEASRDASGSIGGGKINWKKILPIILVVGGIIGFIVITQKAGGIGGLFGG